MIGLGLLASGTLQNYSSRFRVLNPPPVLENRFLAKLGDGIPGVFFPLYGIPYTLSRPYLRKLVLSRIVPCLLLSIAVLGLLFFFTYLPQVAFLAIFKGGSSAWINGTFLVLSESSFIVALLFEAFLVDRVQVDLFDAVLLDKGLDCLLSDFRPIGQDLLPSENTPINSARSPHSLDQERDRPRDPVKRLGKHYNSAVYAPFSCRQITEFIFLLPLNIIPYVGVPLFLYLTGYRAGGLQHWRLYHLLGLTRSDRKAWIRHYRSQYTCFGVVFLILQLVPVLSMLFLLTTAVGSSLWAAHIIYTDFSLQTAFNLATPGDGPHGSIDRSPTLTQNPSTLYAPTAPQPKRGLTVEPSQGSNNTIWSAKHAPADSRSAHKGLDFARPHRANYAFQASPASATPIQSFSYGYNTFAPAAAPTGQDGAQEVNKGGQCPQTLQRIRLLINKPSARDSPEPPRKTTKPGGCFRGAFMPADLSPISDIDFDRQMDAAREASLGPSLGDTLENALLASNLRLHNSVFAKSGLRSADRVRQWADDIWRERVKYRS